MSVVQQIQSSYKAFAVFITSFSGLLVATLADPDVYNALPAGWLKWLTVVGVPAILGFVAWVKRNEPTVEEAGDILARATKRGKHEAP